MTFFSYSVIIFSLYVSLFQKYAMQQAFKTMMGQMDTQNNQSGFSSGSPFPFPTTAAPGSSSAFPFAPPAAQGSSTGSPFSYSPPAAPSSTSSS